MASKFQNRLVGTVVIFALGIITLPILLDGQKKQYKEDFASIPLIPKPGEDDPVETIPSVAQQLNNSPMVSDMPPNNNSVNNMMSNNGMVDHSSNNVTTVSQPSASVLPQPEIVQDVIPATQPPVKKQEAVKPKSVELKAKAPVKQSVISNETAKTATSVREAAPVGQAYVVQLGALRNADKAKEIIATLRLSGYRAYSIPATPVAGQVTRLFVGPDASKQKLQSSLTDLNRLSGLSGQVRNYSTRH